MAERPRPSGRRGSRGRLSRSAEFERVFRQGRSVANRYLVVYAFPRDQDAASGSRLGISVSRKVGGAVDRNRVKRLLREAFNHMAETVPDGHDVVIVARPDARELAAGGGLAAVSEALRELIDRVDLRAPSA